MTRGYLFVSPFCFLFVGRFSSCTIPRMENARDDISALDEPALAGAEGIGEVDGAVAPEPPSAPHGEDAAPSVADGLVAKLGSLTAPAAESAAVSSEDLDAEERRRAMHASFNNRISYLCKLAALVIAVVALATMALGHELPQFVMMGLCLSVALLAIAMLQDHHQRK